MNPLAVLANFAHRMSAPSYVAVSSRKVDGRWVPLVGYTRWNKGDHKRDDRPAARVDFPKNIAADAA